MHLVILSAPCKFARHPQPAWVGSAARGCRGLGEGPPSSKSHFIYSPHHLSPVHHPLPPCKTHQFARNRSNKHRCRMQGWSRGSPEHHVSWVSPQPGEGGGTVGFGMWLLWAPWCMALSRQEPWPQPHALTPLPGDISLFQGVLHILPETDGAMCCLGHTNSTGCSWALCI